jgi:hypothetical protein
VYACQVLLWSAALRFPSLRRASPFGMWWVVRVGHVCVCMYVDVVVVCACA